MTYMMLTDDALSHFRRTYTLPSHGAMDASPGAHDIADKDLQARDKVEKVCRLLSGTPGDFGWAFRKDPKVVLNALGLDASLYRDPVWDSFGG
jgi:hypothetical protein